jgi:uncharacterized protein YkwD
MAQRVSSTRALRKSSVGAAALAMVLALMLSACSPELADRDFEMVNSLRSSVGVAPLARSGELNAKAQKQADRMAARGSIFHSKSLSSGVSKGWTNIGENVAMAGSIEDAQRALEGSAGHYANMTNGVYTEMGVAVTVKNGTVYVVQVFVAR